MHTASELLDDQWATPFESWCERQGVHPDAFGAFDRSVMTLDTAT